MWSVNFALVSQNDLQWGHMLSVNCVNVITIINYNGITFKVYIPVTHAHRSWYQCAQWLLLCVGCNSMLQTCTVILCTDCSTHGANGTQGSIYMRLNDNNNLSICCLNLCWHICAVQQRMVWVRRIPKRTHQMLRNTEPRCKSWESSHAYT